ncbi:tRNA (adenosine(37)-N6)-threonylcarbamoyltransferase complex ATPase subunit type 1 TsaE [Alistipes sp. OttesenSCG-928-B03]|nr:tRNA (adenosine(37)-N6)-threonylcarbamoyltransferase complex ATPase subunit type 1 TsaE [Alistipes sp. OttesenSCG-928-B03]
METIVIDSQAELPDVAERILELTGERSVVAFYGVMGAGKTTLIKEIASQLGVADTVTSPTFALVNQYETAAGDSLFHFDFYRIDRIEEAFDLGYEEYFSSGCLCLVEWPEKIESLLPPDAMHVTILTHPDDTDSRTITIE